MKASAENTEIAFAPVPSLAANICLLFGAVRVLGGLNGEPCRAVPRL